jgi:hypothetical protein
VKVLLLHLDGKLPNLALMRLARHHRDRGDQVELRHTGNVQAVEPRLGDPAWGRVYASLIDERTRPVARRVLEVYPGALVGGTGWDLSAKLEDLGVDPETPPDYSDYPRWRQSMGFTQRGCRLKCRFCVVPRKEGKVTEADSIERIWRGDPWPREIVLLDNDFFGQPRWVDRIAEIKAGGYKVSFSQGINARLLSDEAAAAIASVPYRAMPTPNRRTGQLELSTPRIYTAWDGRKDERVLFRGLEALARHGVKPDHVMVYMLIGEEDGETHADRDHRRRRLREWGARPYPMPYRRTRDLLGFARWVIGAFDKTTTWEEWLAAGYSPRRLQLGGRRSLPLFREDEGEAA